MKKYLLAVFVAILTVFSVYAQGPAILFEKTSPKQVYAAERLQRALKENNYGKLPAATPFEIRFTINNEMGKEALNLFRTLERIIPINDTIYEALSLSPISHTFNLL